MKKFIATALMPFAVMTFSGAAWAASNIQLSSDVFVEKQRKTAEGTTKTTLEPPNIVTPGDNLVFVVKFKNNGSQTAEKFVVTNPLPKAVIFNGTSDGMEVVSIDGGKSWGFLSTLRVEGPGGKVRPALMSDVTHIRWNLNQKLASGSEGKLIFRGIVR